MSRLHDMGDESEFVVDPYVSFIFHRNGVPWHKAALPSRFHHHHVQTYGYPGDAIRRVDRCACGAIRLDNRGWMNRNQTRKDRRRDKKGSK